MRQYEKRGRPNVAIVVLFSIGVVVLAIMVGSRHPAAFLGSAAVALLILLAWRARTSYYECETCASTFQLSMWSDFISPNMIDRKLVRCPSCGVRRALPVLKRVR